MNTVTAVIVARAGSRRLPNKALLPFADGRSLIAHAAWRLAQCEEVDRVICGSDSDAIMADAAKEGALPLRRDEFHCDESRCSANEMIRDVVARIAGDIVLWAHPTNPLIRPATYDHAVRMFLDGERQGYDSLLSVYEVRRHAWKGNPPRPINYNPCAPEHQPAAKCEPIWFQDGAIFIQRRAAMERNSYFFGTRPRLLIVPPYEVADVDALADFHAARQAWHLQTPGS
jgi:CMP-N,N'-diacetyllegionaminic acid synthase